MLKIRTVRDIYTLLFLVSLFLIPFNSYEGFSFFGEYRREGALFFILAGLFVVCIEIYYRKRIYLPQKTPILKILLIFLCWIVVCSLVNLPDILGLMMKGVSGPNRLFRQLVSLCLSLVVVPYFFFVVLNRFTIREILVKLRYVFFLSLIFTSVYSVFEIAIVFFKMGYLKPIHSVFDYVPFVMVKYHDMRISSITQEPPYFAIYLITLFGWMLSYIITGNRIYRFIPCIVVLVLAILSGSRTALVVITAQLIGFLLIMPLFGYTKLLKRFAVVIVGIAVVLLIISPKSVMSFVKERIDTVNFKKNLTENVSNKSRLGIQVATMKVFGDNPITGVGYGQQSYYNRFYFPSWSSTDNYEFRLWYKNPNRKSFPPGYNLYVRLLAETGVIGFLLFLSFLGILFYCSIKLLKNTNLETKVLGLISIISLFGFAINWLQIDTFRLFGFALCLVVLYITVSKSNEEGLIKNTPVE